MIQHHLKRLNDEFFNGKVNLTPFTEVIASLNHEIDSYSRRIDITEGDHAYIARIVLPGFKIADIDVELKQGVLTVRAKRGEEDLERSLYLGTDIDEDKITAKLEDGILSICLPRVEAAKPRKVKVT